MRFAWQTSFSFDGVSCERYSNRVDLIYLFTTMDQASPSPTRSHEKRPPLLGIILLILGVVWLLNTMGFYWARGVWLPLLLIVFGIYLITKKGKR